MNKFILALTTASLLALTACGGGGDEDAPVQVNQPTNQVVAALAVELVAALVVAQTPMPLVIPQNLIKVARNKAQNFNPPQAI